MEWEQAALAATVVDGGDAFGDGGEGGRGGNAGSHDGLHPDTSPDRQPWAVTAAMGAMPALREPAAMADKAVS